MRTGGDSWYGNRRRPDLVRHLLADEDHLDRRCGTWPLATQARNGDKKVQTPHLSRRSVIDGCETTATESGEDRFRGAADKHHRDCGIDRATAADEDVSPRSRGPLVSCGDASPDPHRTPFLTPASLMGGRRGDCRSAHRCALFPQRGWASAERLEPIGLIGRLSG